MSNLELKELEDLVEQTFIDSIAWKLKDQTIELGTLTPNGKEALKSISGLDFKEIIHFCLHSSDLRHIYKHHYGANESQDSGLLPLSMEDIRNIANILALPDKIEYLGDDGKGKKFAFYQNKGDGVLKIIEVYAQKKAKLTVKTFYNSKAKRDGNMINLARSMALDAPSHTSKNVPSIKKRPTTPNAPETSGSTSETIVATLSGANIPILLEYK